MSVALVAGSGSGTTSFTCARDAVACNVDDARTMIVTAFDAELRSPDVLISRTLEQVTAAWRRPSSGIETRAGATYLKKRRMFLLESLQGARQAAKISVR
ncbi:hypothetical protein A8B73_19980 [Methylosinus sp. 3S-1]|nr:hypothetical protein A8B73_19980 [Methylosinus sp. 3S-1]